MTRHDARRAPPTAEALALEALAAFGEAGLAVVRVAPSGKIVDCTSGFRDLAGLSDVELVATNVADVIDATIADDVVAALIDGRGSSTPVDIRLRRGDGELRWVALTSRPVTGRNDNGVSAIWIVTDIDERKRREIAADQRSARFENFHRTSPDGFMMFRSVRGDDGAIVDFEWVLINAAACRIVDRDDLVGKRLLEQMPGNRDAGLFAAYVGVVETGMPWQDEFPYTFEGMDAWFRCTAIAVEDGFAVSFADVTQARRAREALAQSEAFTRHVLDNLFAFVGVLDREGTLQLVNKPPLDVGGLERSDVIGRKFWDCFWWSHDPAKQDRLRRDCEAALSGDIIRYDTEIRIAGDKRLWIDFQLSPLRDDTGQITHLIPSGIDVSLRKDKEERIDVLLREVNHRAKNHLAVVQSVARQTARSSSPDRFVTDLIERLQGLARSQDLIIENRWKGVDLHGLVRAQLHHLGEAANHRISIAGPAMEIAPEAAQGVGMAIHELASNAVRHGALSTSAGRVTLEWRVGGLGDTPMLEMQWSEQEGPRVTAPSHAGFGRTVIERLAAHAVGGEVSMTFEPAGLRWRLTAPLDPLTTAGRVYRTDLVATP